MKKNENIKSARELAIMRENGKILAEIFDSLSKLVKHNTPTLLLEEKFIEMCNKKNVQPSCKGYSPYGMPPFPTGLCISLNSESVHCFPKKDKIIKEGDIVTIDTVINRNGLHVDAAINLVVPYKNPTVNEQIDYEEKLKLSNTAINATLKAIEKVKEGVNIGTISNVMQKVTQKNGYNVLTDYAGHGIGVSMHEFPEIPCFGKKGSGPKLKAGMTICVETLVCEGSNVLEYKSPWETYMKDNKNWAQFEHTVLVTKEGYELLTTR